MAEEVWKCFRCNLTFRDEGTARMHHEIVGHPTFRIKILVT